MKALILYFINSMQGSVAKEIKHKAYNMFTYHEQSSTPVRSKHFKLTHERYSILTHERYSKLTHDRYSKSDPQALLKK